jgi:hypothetical protein
MECLRCNEAGAISQNSLAVGQLRARLSNLKDGVPRFGQIAQPRVCVDLGLLQYDEE